MLSLPFNYNVLINCVQVDLNISVSFNKRKSFFLLLFIITAALPRLRWHHRFIKSEKKQYGENERMRTATTEVRKERTSLIMTRLKHRSVQRRNEGFHLSLVAHLIWRPVRVSSFMAHSPHIGTQLLCAPHFQTQEWTEILQLYEELRFTLKSWIIDLKF